MDICKYVPIWLGDWTGQTLECFLCFRGVKNPLNVLFPSFHSWFVSAFDHFLSVSPSANALTATKAQLSDFKGHGEIRQNESWSKLGSWMQLQLRENEATCSVLTQQHWPQDLLGLSLARVHFSLFLLWQHLSFCHKIITCLVQAYLHA